MQLRFLIFVALLSLGWPAEATKNGSNKWQRIEKFSQNLPQLKSWIDVALASPSFDEQTAQATIIETMRQSGIRVGSWQYALREKDPSFGATSLRTEHVIKIDEKRGVVKLRFRSKGTRGPKGKKQGNITTVTLLGKTLARAYKIFVDQANGGSLFRVPTKSGSKRVSGRDLRATLKPYGGINHDLRTLHIMQLFDQELAHHPRPKTKSEAVDLRKKAAEKVASRVNHGDYKTTKTNYISPQRWKTAGKPRGGRRRR